MLSRYLIQQGIQIEQRDRLNQTAYHIATRLGHDVLYRELLDSRFDTDESIHTLIRSSRPSRQSRGGKDDNSRGNSFRSQIAGSEPARQRRHSDTKRNNGFLWVV